MLLPSCDNSAASRDWVSANRGDIEALLELGAWIQEELGKEGEHPFTKAPRDVYKHDVLSEERLVAHLGQLRDCLDPAHVANRYPDLQNADNWLDHRGRDRNAFIVWRATDVVDPVVDVPRIWFEDPVPPDSEGLVATVTAGRWRGVAIYCDLKNQRVLGRLPFEVETPDVIVTHGLRTEDALNSKAVDDWLQRNQAASDGLMALAKKNGTTFGAEYLAHARRLLHKQTADRADAAVYEVFSAAASAQRGK